MKYCSFSKLSCFTLSHLGGSGEKRLFPGYSALHTLLPTLKDETLLCNNRHLCQFVTFITHTLTRPREQSTFWVCFDLFFFTVLMIAHSFCGGNTTELWGELLPLKLKQTARWKTLVPNLSISMFTHAGKQKKNKKTTTSNKLLKRLLIC